MEILTNLNLTNRKAFLFEAQDSTLFVVLFTTDDTGKTLVKSYGHAAFPNLHHFQIFTINATTKWLQSMGCVLIKRLTLTENVPFTKECESKIWQWLKDARINRTTEDTRICA